MRFAAKGHKNLVFVLALVLALSSFGGVPVSDWVHTDGSLCYTCPRSEPASAPADDCCAPVQSDLPVHGELVVSAIDCQSCCEARSTEQSQRKILRVKAAVLSEKPVMAQVFH